MAGLLGGYQSSIRELQDKHSAVVVRLRGDSAALKAEVRAAAAAAGAAAPLRHPRHHGMPGGYVHMLCLCALSRWHGCAGARACWQASPGRQRLMPRTS